MATKKLLFSALPLLVGVMSVFNSALVQAADDTAANDQPAVSAPDNRPGSGERQHNPGAYVQKRLTHLKEKLQITSDQEPKWQSFSDTVLRQTEQLRSAHLSMRDVPAKAPERIDRQVQLMKQRVAGFEAIAQSAKDLYVSLTPEQQRIADERLLRFHGKHTG